MTFVPEILWNQRDYDREDELFGAAWEELQDLRAENKQAQEIISRFKNDADEALSDIYADLQEGGSVSEVELIKWTSVVQFLAEPKP